MKYENISTNKGQENQTSSQNGVYINNPAMAAVIMVARKPATRAFIANLDTTGFFDGTRAPIPPISIAMLPKWVNPHNA